MIYGNRNPTFGDIKNLYKEDNKTESTSFDDEVLPRIDLI